jgi:hypothetical protein
MTREHPDLRKLLHQFKGDGRILSCYVDLSSLRQTQWSWPGPFKAKATAVRTMLANDEEAVEQFERNLRAIGKALDSPELRHAPGAAVFVALQREFLQTFALDAAPENDLVVHQSPYLVPLLQAMIRQRKHLVVLTDTHHGVLYSATRAALQRIEEVEGDVPRKQHSSGQRWGKEQATIARRRDDRIRHYLKELVERMEHAWAEQAFQGIILLGKHDLLEHLKKEMPTRLSCQIVSEKPHEWVDDPARLAEVVRETIEDQAKAEERRIAEVVERRMMERYAIAAGPRAVLEALQTGRVGPRGQGYLVLGPDPREVVARCTMCRFLSVDMADTCPRCHAPCADASLWEEILLLALRHQIIVHCLEGNELVAEHGGVIAVVAEMPAEAPLLV